jgi:hypothetical protein
MIQTAYALKGCEPPSKMDKTIVRLPCPWR